MPDALVLAEINKHNQTVLARKRIEKKAFFDTVEKNPLTAEQVHACICMDDNVMVVAAAGSGKTSTMVAKAGYVLGEGLADADQILMLAFNAAAAKELGERVAERLKDVPGIEGISSQTFHAFGLTVIGAATGQKPRLAPWVDQGEEGQVMTDIAKELIASDKGFARDWDMFRTIYAREMRGGRDGSDPDGYKDGKRGLNTASGAVVRSDEERRIADWLFFWGVKFEYERKYEHETADEQHSSYHPDFFYPDHHLYHEHFAIDRDGRSPFGDTYLQSATWKRALHKEKGTELFETMSHEMRAGRRGATGERLVELALVRLEQELVKRGQVLEFDPNRESTGFRATSGQAVVRLIQTFQKHVKNNGLTMAQLHTNIESSPGDASRLELFLSIYERMAEVWDKKLREGNYIDFEDMLTQAAEHIEQGRYTSPFTVVLADEFQDSSRARVRMLKALTNRPGRRAHLCVVGDDWQGINRFAGSDIAVMTEFEKLFGNATSLTLGTTFRCPPRITTVSSNFIQRNPAQIRKQVRTTSTATGTPIRIFGFKDVDGMPEHIGTEMAQLHQAAVAGAKKTKVLILGRYRSDEPYMLSTWQRRFGDRLDISYKTVHGSKGLEAEHVFLVNMIGGNRGFPSQLEDDPVLQIAMPAPDPFPVAEERRLFYVALTRASRDIRIYTTLDKPSSFVNELQKMDKIPVEAIDGEAAIPCPKCHQGVMKVRNGKYGPFLSCSAFPKCDHKQKIVEATSPAKTANGRFAR
ncbi:UvrD-helicase domain-containing protein [Devosia rhizoryzae]|uniref:DNA 3'-5' helicase n=1 Tax=Devosia rhizoryzae TaxID=2774137 RepID=A0ABX7C445_9HYPH|nr:UvrD-helicase domain-containing protein [Devosia rhizoryzae]QQR39000.1 UvrD-helicase domain-containing protein [Devosia rhizoryzae]